MKRRNRWSLVVGLAGAITFGGMLQPAHGESQDRTGRLVSSYRASESGKPEWVARAEQASKEYLKLNGSAFGVTNADAELVLWGADSDDLSTTHIRLNQVWNGIPVFGGQLVAHLDGNGAVSSVNGDFFNVSTSAKQRVALQDKDAINIALNTLGYKGDFATAPSAVLKVLPTEKGARLTYQVTLEIEDGTDATAHHEYFVDATDGSIAFYFNSLDSENRTGKPMVPTAANGTGNTLYSGAVTLGTDYVGGTYYLRDLNRGGMETKDMRNGSTTAYNFTDADNVWGNGATSSTQSAGASAHFAGAKTWDYFLNVFGRRGIDGNGFKVVNRVHYGNRYNNAFWNGSVMTYGDGDGTTFSPLVSVDVGGHEITHGLTTKTANLTYSGQSGAINEAMSDIFGTAIEFYTGTVGGRAADYDIGEDIYTPGTSGDALRSMSNPALYGDPDHYANRYTGTSDNGGVHINSGIANQAFWLLAAGGTNRTSGQTVVGIGNRDAEKIFYRSLTVYLTPSSNFAALRVAALKSATDLFGSTSTQYTRTAQAFTAVGIN